MSADCLVPVHGSPLGSIRAWGRHALAALPGIFMAAGAARVPSEPTPSHEETTSSREGTRKGSGHPPIWWQATLCGTLLAAMVTNRYLRFQNGGTPGSFLTTAFLLQDAIAALTSFPAVYAKLQFETDQPLFAQLGVIFTAGMGWQHLIFSVAPH
jgi:hypothetical protein